MVVDRKERARWQGWAVPPLIGLAIWAIWAAVTQPTWTEVLLLGSPFVVVPLGLAVAARGEAGAALPGLARLARFAPLIALSAAASIGLDTGAAAALVAVPWLVYTAVIAVFGAIRLLARRTMVDPAISVDVGLIFLAVGGVWLVLSRAGSNPMNFGDAIVALTAVHFHYAGFALPIVIGIVATRLQRSPVIPILVVIGVPLTAIGITVGGSTEWAGATTMAVGGIATATLLGWLALRTRGTAGALMGVAGVALLGGMSLALGWSWSRQFGWQYLDLAAMARYHGTLNAIGFGITALIGLNLSAPHTAGASGLLLHARRPTEGDLEALVDRHRDEDPSSAPDLLDRPAPNRYHHDSWHRTVPGDGWATARAALDGWAGHHEIGIALWPTRPPLETGTTVGLAVPLGPVWLTAVCRIVGVIDEPNRYGFTYATLGHHPEDGAESFLVERQANGSVTVTIEAISRPALTAGRLCPPLNRRLQARAVQQYLTGLTGSGPRP